MTMTSHFFDSKLTKKIKLYNKITLKKGVTMQYLDLALIFNNKKLLIKAGTALAILLNILMFAFMLTDISKDIVDYTLFILSIFFLIIARTLYVEEEFANKSFVAVSIFFILTAEIITLIYKKLF